MTTVGVRPVIPVYNQRGDFSGLLSLLETAGPSAPDSISDGARCIGQANVIETHEHKGDFKEP